MIAWPQEQVLQAVPRATRKTYPAIEHEPVDVPITEVVQAGAVDVYPEVLGKGYFGINMDGRALVLSAKGYVGRIPLNDRVAVDVRPRLPMRQLDRLLNVSGVTPALVLGHLRQYDPSSEDQPSMLRAFAASLIELLRTVEGEGLHREQFQRTGPTSFPRGRVLLDRTVREHLSRGVQYRVTAAWHEQSVDTAANRCLKFAVFYLASLLAQRKEREVVDRQLITALNRVYSIFNGVQLDQTRSWLDAEVVQEPRSMGMRWSYYWPALDLTNALLRRLSVDLLGGGSELWMTTMLVRMETVFEAYVRNALRRCLPSTSLVLDGNKEGRRGLLDGSLNPPATPDVVIRERSDPAASTSIVLEVKYKPELPDRDDINQVITYAASYRAPIAILLHPCAKDQPPGQYLVGRIDRISLFRYAFNLDADDLADEETRLGSAIEGILRGD